MKCPNCKAILGKVMVESRCWQNAYIDENEIGDYGSVQGIDETLRVECYECGTDITADCLDNGVPLN